MIWVDKIEDIDFSSAWKANIFTHPGIANGVLREEISGLKKTYCVEDNILVFVNIFSDVKFTFDCLSMIFPTPTPEPGRIYTAQESSEDRWVAVNPLKATCNSVTTWHKMSQKLTQVSLNSWMNFLHFCETTLIAMRYRRVGVLKRQSKELYLRELVKTKEKLNFYIQRFTTFRSAICGPLIENSGSQKISKVTTQNQYSFD